MIFLVLSSKTSARKTVDNNVVMKSLRCAEVDLDMNIIFYGPSDFPADILKLCLISHISNTFSTKENVRTLHVTF